MLITAIGWDFVTRYGIRKVISVSMITYTLDLSEVKCLLF